MWEVSKYRNIAFCELENIRMQAVKTCVAAPDRRFLILAEPRPVFTFGRQAKKHDLLWTDEELRNRGAVTFSVSRGGLWTFHGPGQILIYPIVQLRKLFGSSKSVAIFLGRLREAILHFLKQQDIPVHCLNHPFGIYSSQHKLVSFGISVERGIISHGAALYGRDQSAYFGGIIGCGASHIKTVSIEELGKVFDFEEASNRLVQCIEMAFHDAKN